MFPPGTIHVVYTEKDSVFCGGYFLTPCVMSQFLRVLGQIELDPSRTNNEKNVDFFQFLENFIGETLQTSKPELSKRQLNKFVVTLENYLELELPVEVEDDNEEEHFQRRQAFIEKVVEENWVKKLKDKVISMSWDIK